MSVSIKELSTMIAQLMTYSGQLQSIAQSANTYIMANAEPTALMRPEGLCEMAEELRRVAIRLTDALPDGEVGIGGETVDGVAVPD